MSEHKISASLGKPFIWFCHVLSSWNIAFGMQMVLFPWMVAIELKQSAQWVGIAQMSLLLPTLLLSLHGGMIADRYSARRLLVILHLLVSLPAFMLALVIWRGQLSYHILIIYALAMGTIHAFIAPSLGALVSTIAGNQVQKAITIGTGLMFFVQIIGFMLASSAEYLGAPLLLTVQGMILLSGAWFASNIKIVEAGKSSGSDPMEEIREGIRVVLRTQELWVSFLVNFIVGVLFMGTFLVLVPLMVRDIYHYGALEIAIANMIFILGTIFSAVLLLRIGGVQRQGRALFISLLLGSGFLLILSLPIPFWLFLLVGFCWGCCAGIALTMGRTIMQEYAPDHCRARVISVYEIGAVGGAPLGALFCGYNIELFGYTTAALIPAVMMVLSMYCVYYYTALRRFDRLSEEISRK